MTPRRTAGTGCGRGTAATAGPAPAPRRPAAARGPARARRVTTSLAMISIESRTPSRRSPRRRPCAGPTPRAVVPPDLAVGVGRERSASRQVSARSTSPPALVVVALADQLQVDRQVAALGPAFPLGDQSQAAGQHQRKVGVVRCGEQRGDSAGGRGVLRGFVDVERLEQRLGVLGEQVLDRLDGDGVHDGQRRCAGQAGGGDAGDRTVDARASARRGRSRAPCASVS